MRPLAGAAVLALLLAGCGTTKTITTTVATTTTQTETTTEFETETLTHTHTVKAVPPAPPSSAVQSFSGNGGKVLGTINVRHDSTLLWTDDGDFFATNDDEDAIGVDSSGHSGSSFLAPGSYRNVSINAVGNWTMKIVPKS